MHQDTISGSSLSTPSVNDPITSVVDLLRRLKRLEMILSLEVEALKSSTGGMLMGLGA